MADLKKQIDVVISDLGIYYRGLEVAVGRNNIKDVVRYLNNMKDEVVYALETIGPIEQKVGETEVAKKEIEKVIQEHRSKVDELQKKLKKLKEHPIINRIEAGSSGNL
jgi:chromosome segregation ATPase